MSQCNESTLSIHALSNTRYSYSFITFRPIYLHNCCLKVSGLSIFSCCHWHFNFDICLIPGCLSRSLEPYLHCVMTGSSRVSHWFKGGSEVRWGSEPQGLKWLRGNAPQRRVDTRVSDARESSMQGSWSLQCRFWVGSEQVKLRAKALKSEQGFGRSRASFTWAEPCQASRGAEHAGGVKVDIWTKGKYSEVGTD